MQPRPNVIVFDVNETLSDMAPMASRFTEVGAPSPLARVWFAVLEAVLAGVALNRPAGEAADYILSGFSDLGLHPDVPEGVRLLAEASVSTT